MCEQSYLRKSFIAFFVLLFTLSLSSACLADMMTKDFVQKAMKTIKEISVADANAEMDSGKAVVLDCRTASELPRPQGGASKSLKQF